MPNGLRGVTSTDRRKTRRGTTTVSIRGFAAMDLKKRREIASLGGKAAHVKGTAHEWSREQARIAGRKGALARSAASGRSAARR